MLCPAPGREKGCRRILEIAKILACLFSTFRNATTDCVLPLQKILEMRYIAISRDRRISPHDATYRRNRSKKLRILPNGPTRGNERNLRILTTWGRIFGEGMIFLLIDPHGFSAIPNGLELAI